VHTEFTRGWRYNVLWSVFALTACGGGGGGGGQSVSPLAISPSSITLDANMTKTFQASGGQLPYVFTVSSGLGTITAAGAFTAPDSPGTAVVAVTDSLGSVARSSVTINTPLTAMPDAVTVAIGTTQAFQGSGGTPPYSYALVSGTGTIDASSGLYQAPGSPGNATLKVSDAVGSSIQATVTVNARLSIQPASITITAASGQTYAFSGKDGALNYRYSVLSGPGSISSGGVFTAGNASGTATVQVTDRQGTTATATVTSVFVRTNGPVYSAVTDDTSWYLGGAFSAVNAYEAPHMTVINADDGSPNLACDLQRGFDDSVYTVVSDGTAVYVGGRFTHYRGVSTPGGLVRIDPVTCQVLGTYFSPTDNATGTFALSLYGSALYVIAQSQTYQSAFLTSGLIKVDATTGALDAAFQANFPRFNNLVTFTPMALLATAANVYAGQLKLDAKTGAYDPSFSVFFGNNVQIQEYLVDGTSLYAAGATINGVYGVAKVDANTGALDPTFVPEAFDGTVASVTLVGNALYVAGAFNHYGAQQRLGVAKLDATTGALDSLFVPPADLSGHEITGVQAALAIDGALYIAGNFFGSSSTPAFGLAKLDLNSGAIDGVFTQPAGLNAAANSICRVGDILFVGGDFTTYRGVAASNLAKLKIADGTPDPTFLSAKGTDGPVNALVLAGGALYLGGKFQHYGSSAAPYLAKVDPSTGALDTTFTQTTGPDQPVYSMTTDNSWLYVAGEFTSYRGVLNAELAKVDLVDGSRAPGFADGFYGGGASSVQIQGGFLYVFDNSGLYENQTYLTLPRIDAQTGALDKNFPLLHNGYAGSAITFNGNVGYASVAQFIPGMGDPSSYITKFDATTGAIDTNFHTPINVAQSFVDALLPLGSSLYVVTTSNYLVDDRAADFLARVDAATGTPDASFSVPSSMTNAPMRMLTTTGADLWVGGDFTQYRGGPGYYFIPIDPVTGAVADPQ
jgi:Domain of unknown function (DUF5122) beta-propeller